MEELKEAPKQETGTSFKKLKKMAKKKGAKQGAGPDPTHSAYLAGLKGIQSSLVDIDYVQTEYWLFALCAEQNAQVTAYAIDQERADASPRVISKGNKFEGGLRLTSASISKVKQSGEASQNLSIAQERALPVKFIVAVSCFDHCQVKVLQLTFHKEQFTFSPVQNTLMNVHAMPVGKIRLSKNYPRLLVTCGYEKDVYLKLWNVTKEFGKNEPA